VRELKDAALARPIAIDFDHVIGNHDLRSAGSENSRAVADSPALRSPRPRRVGPGGPQSPGFSNGFLIWLSFCMDGDELCRLRVARVSCLGPAQGHQASRMSGIPSPIHTRHQMDGFYEEGIQLRSLRMRLLNTFSDQASEARTRHVKHPTPTPRMNNQKYKSIRKLPSESFATLAPLSSNRAKRRPAIRYSRRQSEPGKSPKDFNPYRSICI
jgi:hypothetical protein